MANVCNLAAIDVMSCDVDLLFTGEICESFMAGRCTEGADCRYAHPDTSAFVSIGPSLSHHTDGALR